MSEDTSDGFADQPRPMVKCRGCGFNVERGHERSGGEHDVARDKWYCDVCIKCESCPDMRESYRRGFNAGLDALRQRIRDSLDRATHLQKVEH